MLLTDLPTSRRSLRAALLAIAPLCVLAAPLAAQSGHSDLAQAELQRRSAAASEAHELLKSGDEAYEAARYEEAATAYRGALDLLPAGAPAISELRREAVERYAQASIEVARKQRRLGDVEGAETTINQVLVDEIAPQHPGATETLEWINDPIRTNPSGTKEHTRDIEEVRQLLYSAEGAYNLGKFDQAKMVYEDVLKVDPYNVAARRGMEKVTAAQTDYYRAARDEARSSMLADVAEGWELKVNDIDEMGTDFDPLIEGGQGVNIATKLQNLVIPMIFLEDVTIQEAMDYLRQQSVALDTSELDPTQKGINMVLDLGSPDSEVGRSIREIRFNLNLRNVPFNTALDYITEATKTVAVTQPYALVIRPAGSDATDMLLKSYRVPPDFLTAGSSGGGGSDVASNDPFAEPSDDGLIAKKLSAREILETRGVSFPEGATAMFNSGNSTLRVRNTAVNHSIVEQIVEAMANTEPTHVIVEIKMIKTQKKRLEELSFDWLLSDFGLGGNGIVPGIDSTYLTGGTQGNGGDLSDVALPPGQFSGNPITAGNRSGSEAIGANAIDELILAGSTGGGRTTARAPGALWVNGVINDGNVTMLMRGLDQKTGVDLAAVPSVVTRSGQAASIRVTQELTYPTEYEPPELPNSVGGGGTVDLGTGAVTPDAAGVSPVTPATPTSFEMRETGIVMEVLPTVSQNKRYVDITLAPNITDFDGFLNYGSPINSSAPGGLGGFGVPVEVEITPNRILMPVFSVMKTGTSLTVADGQTIVIGGLMQEKTQKVEDKTPILGDIPVFGRLFQSQAYSPVQTAIVFFVTVTVVDAAGRPFNP
ncbi:Amuc_1098 family type IV pilus outer membrane protein [Haloferula chungangensis]|uniref:Amuc_1098 family type IV pilus outer membrane protein n=1 Tax=Haloferula chungangensis TaxID=1048331 RepID=A0ABW2L4E0_9BACT